jgi:hypothetical protein
MDTSNQKASKMRYEEFVRKICGEDWKNGEIEEAYGGLGVACIKAYIYGAKPVLNDMANHLGVHPDDLYTPFNRLFRAGAFTKWNIKKDKTFLGHLGNEEHDRIWGHVAGIAGGFVGV